MTIVSIAPVLFDIALPFRFSLKSYSSFQIGFIDVIKTIRLIYSYMELWDVMDLSHSTTISHINYEYE